MVSFYQSIRRRLLASLALLALFPPLIAQAQPVQRSREFPPGTISQIADLPVSRLRARLQSLPLAAQQRALGVLRHFHFPELDLNSLDADLEGGVFYEDHFPGNPAEAEPVIAASEPVIAQAPVAVSPFPRSLHFHSHPGAPAVLYLNFAGETVAGTAWNFSVGRTQVVAVPFSLDPDHSTFNDVEHTIIRRVWQRVAEDYAPFAIDVTTERPATLGTRTAHALITRSTDSSNHTNPSASAGGVAYVDVFGQANYGYFRPAWIYANNLGNSESSIAEVISHEVGHNLGLSHDGQTEGSEYYSGHGSGGTSWGPIMGASYGRNLTQWSKGEYYRANNTQDDLAMITAKVPYRSDESIDRESAQTLLVTGTTNVLCTTLENDPANTNASNKGVIHHGLDTDIFTFTTGTGPVRLTVSPWISSAGTRGGNLDIQLELRDRVGALLLTNNSPTQAVAQLQMNLSQGTYYLHIRNSGVGNPLTSPPSGYTSYGSAGQYHINGYVAPQTAAGGSVQLTVAANNDAWGEITPKTDTYSVGTVVELVATPSPWFRFVGWTNGLSGTNNPVSVVLTTNLSIRADFAEVMTATHPTPYWWLAAHGWVTNQQVAIETLGRNGLPLWQSYVAGLNPADSSSQFRLTLTPTFNGAATVLTWDPQSGRAYTIWSTTNLSKAFFQVPGGSNLPATVRSFTNAVSATRPVAFYRMEVRKL
jgi:hypothetical protein